MNSVFGNNYGPPVFTSYDRKHLERTADVLVDGRPPVLVAVGRCISPADDDFHQLVYERQHRVENH